jgi:hypothetical protein
MQLSAGAILANATPLLKEETNAGATALLEN